jgi:hypothetical protein
MSSLSASPTPTAGVQGSPFNLYWGDTHNHCGISYGYGSLDNALRNARGHLDFCAIIGHAMWHDMPARVKGLEFTVDFHTRGFQKLAQNWDEVRSTIEAANGPSLVTFHGYEAHSRAYGDYYLLSPSSDLPILEAASPIDLVRRLAPRPAIAVPHHIAYLAGFRGIDWSAFSPQISPVVEVYSKHGCGMSDRSPYPFLHGMGPRSSRNTARGGMRLGYRFGFVASTDHHAGYPGSYGDGRMAVYATEKTRDAIWQAMCARRTYAATGDKIVARYSVAGADMGAETEDVGSRAVQLDVTACDTVDKIIIYKNLSPWQVVCGEELQPQAPAHAFKVRVELGWGESVDGYRWQCTATVRDGTLLSVEPCFRGRNYLGPVPTIDDDANMNAVPNSIIGQTQTSVVWECMSFKNPTTLHSQTSALILEVAGDGRSVLALDLNGKQLVVSISQLLDGSQGMHVGGYKSEAFLVHRAVPEHEYRVSRQWTDLQPQSECDTYDVEIRQVNGQCAWLSPVFVLR